MADITGASLQPIYERLTGAPRYHPLESNTFGDWATEAGDLVTFSRDGEEYQVPVQRATVTWKRGQQVQISANGREKRDPVSKASQRKYNRGSSALRNSRDLYLSYTGLYNGLYSSLSMTESRLKIQFKGLYDGLESDLEMTRSQFRLDFKGLYDGLESELTLTRSELRVEFSGMYDGLSSDISMTRSALTAQFNDMYAGLSSEFELTASRMGADFNNAYQGLSSTFEVTASRMGADFNNAYKGLSSTFEVTASRMGADFNNAYQGLSSTFEVTASRMGADFNNAYQGLSSTFEVTASRMGASFNEAYTGLSSTFEVTASRMASDFNDAYQGLSASFEVTASRMGVSFNEAYTGLSSTFELTASRMASDFHDAYTGLSGSFETTASQMRAAFNEAYTGLSSEFTLTASQMRSSFEEAYTGLSSEFTQTASRLASEIASAYEGLSSGIEQTSSSIKTYVDTKDGQLRSSITQESSRISLVVEGTGANAKVNVAEIVAEINAQTGQSTARIQADKVILTGDVDLNNVLQVSNGFAFFSKPVIVGNLLAGTTISTDGKVTAFEYRVKNSTGSNMLTVDYDELKNAIKSASVSQDGTQLTLTPFSGDPITFNKAASISNLTGSWSGGSFPLTVATNPSTGKTYTIGFSSGMDQRLTLLTNGSVSKYTTGWINVPLQIASVSSGTPQTTTTRYTETLPISVNDLLEEATFTGNNAQGYTPSDGYIGFKKVIVNVPVDAAYVDGQKSVVPEIIGPAFTFTNTSIAYNDVRATARNPYDTQKFQTGRVYLALVKSTFDATTHKATVLLKRSDISYQDAHDNGTAINGIELNATDVYEAGKAYITPSITGPSYQLSGSSASNQNKITAVAKNPSNESNTATGESYVYMAAAAFDNNNESEVTIKYGSSIADARDNGTVFGRVKVNATSVINTGKNSVSVQGPSWATSPAAGIEVQYNTATFTTNAPNPASGTSKSLTLRMQAESFDTSTNKSAVYLYHSSITSTNRIARIMVDASTLVSNAVTAGKNSVSVKGPSWETNPSADINTQNNAVTYTTNAPSPASGTSKTLSLKLRASGWSSNQNTVYLYHSSITDNNRIAKIDIDASSIWSAGYSQGSTDGAKSVVPTISGPSFMLTGSSAGDSNKISAVATNPNDTSKTATGQVFTKMAASTFNGSDESEVTIKYGSDSSSAASGTVFGRVKVNASGIRTAGREEATLSGSWSSGTATVQNVYNSNNKWTTVIDSVQDGDINWGTSGSTGALTVYAKTNGGSRASTGKTLSIAALTVYNRGRDAATVTGSWAGGTVTVNNANNSNNKWYSTIQNVEDADISWGNSGYTGSIALYAKNNGSSTRTSIGKSLGFSAKTVYDRGRDTGKTEATLTGSWSGGKATVQNASNANNKWTTELTSAAVNWGSSGDQGTLILYAVNSDGTAGNTGFSPNINGTAVFNRGKEAATVTGSWDGGKVTVQNASNANNKWYSTIDNISQTSTVNDVNWGSAGYSGTFYVYKKDNGSSTRESTGKQLTISAEVPYKRGQKSITPDALNPTYLWNGGNDTRADNAITFTARNPEDTTKTNQKVLYTYVKAGSFDSSYQSTVTLKVSTTSADHASTSGSTIGRIKVDASGIYSDGQKSVTPNITGPSFSLTGSNAGDSNTITAVATNPKDTNKTKTGRLYTKMAAANFSNYKSEVTMRVSTESATAAATGTVVGRVTVNATSIYNQGGATADLKGPLANESDTTIITDSTITQNNKTYYYAALYTNASGTRVRTVTSSFKVQIPVTTYNHNATLYCSAIEQSGSVKTVRLTVQYTNSTPPFTVGKSHKVYWSGNW